jgi:hypothetical protein
MDIFNNLGQNLVNFYHSAFFVVIKFIMGIYAIVLILDLAMVVILRGFGRDFRVTMAGINIPSQKVTARRWQKIKKRLESGNTDQCKAAILEADKMIDELLDIIEHKGENIPDKLSQLKPGQIEDAEDLIKAHEIRNNIIHDKEFAVSREKTEEVLGIYEKFLEHFGFI